MFLFRSGMLSSFIARHNFAFCIGLAAIYGAFSSGLESDYYIKQELQYKSLSQWDKVIENPQSKVNNTIFRQTLIGMSNSVMFGAIAYFCFDLGLKKLLKTSLTKAQALTCAILIGCTAAKIINDGLGEIFVENIVIKAEDKCLQMVSKGLKYVSGRQLI